MSGDADFMARAIAVAGANLGRTAPNPVVGCVIVRDGVVLAEAATGVGGRPHAEERALAACDARGATAYVTLEPCGARSSGTASCAERLVAAGVARVVIACEDPSPFASGQGLERLKAASLPVETGLLAEAAFELCAGFVHRLKTGRPLVRESVDGATYEAEFRPDEGADLAAALSALGEAGATRLWTPAGGALAGRLRALGLLDPS